MQLTLKQVRQALTGLGLGLALLFVVNTVVGLNEAHNQTREIPVLIARVERLETSITTLAESQVMTRKSQSDIVDIVEQLQGTISLLTRITGKTTGVEQDEDKP